MSKLWMALVSPDRFEEVLFDSFYTCDTAVTLVLNINKLKLRMHVHGDWTTGPTSNAPGP